jgi:alpha-methylacyl-CoA racemase
VSAGLLDGIRVLDLASVGPAARASRWLADYGAEVVKVGPVPAQGGVQITPPFYAYSAGRGTKRVLLDLKAPEGRDAFLALADAADVVIESFRPGVAARLGVGPDDVRARNPRSVYCSTSGYGQDGPHAAWAGHDLDYLAVGGYLHCGGRGPEGKPPLPGATVADSAGGGMHAVMAILAALVRRSATGEGASLDVSVADGVLALMALQVDEHLATGAEPGPGSSLLTGRYACYDTYRAGDGRWLAVAAIEPKFWANLCRALGLERWIDHQLDDAVQDQVRADVAAAFATRHRDEWVAALAPADTCVAPVLSVAELVDDPQFVARGAFAEAVHPTEGRFRQVAPTLAGTVRPEGAVPVPDPGATDTDELLAAAGVGPERCAELRAAGVVA